MVSLFTAGFFYRSIDLSKSTGLAQLLCFTPAPYYAIHSGVHVTFCVYKVLLSMHTLHQLHGLYAYAWLFDI